MTTEDLSFSRDERWKSLSSEQQEGMIDNAFNDQIASDPRFNDLSSEQQQGMRDKYTQSVHNNALGDYDTPAERGLSGFALDTGVDLAKGVVGAGEAVVGVLDIATVNTVGDMLSKVGYDPELTKEFLSEGYSESRVESNKAVADAKGFVETLKALVEHPDVAFGSIIESAPLTVGSAAVAKTVASRLLGSHLIKSGLTAGTPEAIAAASKFFADPKIRAIITLSGAAAEGAATAGSIQEAGRQAGKSWQETVLESASAGVTTAAIGVISSKIPGFEDAETLVATAGRYGTKKSLLESGKTIAKSTFKEGALEELPQSAQEQIFTNLALDRPWSEGVPEASAQGLVVGAAQGGALVTGGQITTQVSGVAKQAGKPKSPRVKADFDPKVSAAVEASDIGDAGTVGHKDYNPTVAIDALHQINRKEDTTPEQTIANVEKAMQIRKEFMDQDFENQKPVIELHQKYLQDKNSLSTEELKTLKKGAKQAAANQDILTDLDSVITSMDSTDVTPTDLKTDLAEAKDGEQVTDSVNRILGSQSGGSDIANYMDFDAIANDPNIDAKTKELVSSIQSMHTARKELATFNEDVSGKSTEQVSSDIFEGSTQGRRFRGINSFHKAIASALENNNTKTAKDELGKLQAWRDNQKLKATTLRNALTAQQQGKELSAEDQANLDILNKQRTDRGQRPFIIGERAERFIKNTELEAKALDNAITVANNVFEAKTGIPPKVDAPSQATTVSPEEAPSVVSPSAGHGQTTAEGVTSIPAEIPATKKVDDTKQALPAAVEEAKTPVNTKANNLIDNTSEDHAVNQHYKAQSDKKLQKNILNHVTDFFAEANKAINNGTFNEFFTLNQSTEADPNAINLVEIMIDFNDKFVTGFNNSFDVGKRGKEQENDPIHDLKIDGKLPDNVLQAMSIAAFKWLATRGSETVRNDDRAMSSILNVPRDTYLGDWVNRLIGHIGQTSTALNADLGREAFKLLGIQQNEDHSTEHDYQERLEASIGLQMLATMEKMGLLERTMVRRSGLQELSAFALGEINQVDKDNFYLVGIPKKNDQKVDFFKIKTVLGVVNRVEEVRTAYNASPNTLDLMLNGERDPLTYSWSKPKSIDSAMKRTDQEVTPEQTQNVLNASQQAWNADSNAVNLFTFLGESGQQKVSGAIDPETAHDINKDTVKGTNLGIKNNINKVYSFLTEATLRPKSYSSDFFIKYEFWKNGRMGMLGSINPQGNKIHRALFSMKAWNVEVDPNNVTHERNFMKALGQSFGLETGKENGLDGLLVELGKILNKEVMQDAIIAMGNFLEMAEDSDIDPEAMLELGADNPKMVADIVAGVKEGGENAITLKGLLEYTRFLNAKAGNTTFTTNLPYEIDGMTNGPILGAIQMVADDTPAEEVLGRLRNGGFIFTETFEDMDTHASNPKNYDAYESTGSTWLAKIAGVYKSVGSAKRKQLEAIQRILDPKKKGLASEDGLVSKVMRKLSKYPTMTIAYGIGVKTLIRNLVNETIIDDGFYARIEQLTSDNDVEGFRQLFKDMVAITGLKVPFDGTKAVINGKMNPSEMRKVKLTSQAEAAIDRVIKATYGKALTEAVEAHFGSIAKTRKTMNESVTVSSALYNTLFKLHLNKRLAASETGVLTRKDYDEITELLTDLLPTINTHSGGKLEVAKKSTARDRTVDNTENRAMVFQSYKNKDNGKRVLPLRSVPKVKGILVKPGVASVVLNVHMQDSYIANDLMGSQAVLNNHDGFTGNLMEGVDMSEQLNEATIDIITNYNMVQEFADSLDRNHALYKELVKEGGFTVSEVNAMEKEAFAEMELTGFTNPNTGVFVELAKGKPSRAIVNAKGAINKLATETTKNKKEITDALVHMAQYPDQGFGMDTGNTEKKEILGVPVKDIDKLTQDKVTEEADEIASAGIRGSDDSKLGSNVSSSDLSTDTSTYADHEEVSADNAVGVYDNIKNKGTVPLDPTWDVHLKGILEGIVVGVMNPVDVYLKQSIDKVTQGVLDTETNNIFISTQVAGANPSSGMLSNGIRMSTGEVYVHELVHSITESGLRLNARLRDQVRIAYNAAEKHLTQEYGKGSEYKVFLNNPAINVNDKANRYEVAAAKERWNYLFGNPPVHTVEEYNSSTQRTEIREYSGELDEFLAYTLTNQNFSKEMANAKIPKRQKVEGRNLQSFLVNLFNDIVDFISLHFKSEKKADNVQAEIYRLAQKLSAKDSAYKTQLSEGLDKVEAGYSKVMDESNKRIKDVVKSTPILRIVNDLATLKDATKRADSPLGEHVRSLIDARNNFSYGFFQKVLDEVKGGTDKIEKLYHLLNMRGVILDQHREAAVRTHKKLLRELYGRELTKEEKTVVTKVGLKTDLSSLLINHNMQGINDLVQNEQALEDRIVTLIDQINNDPDLASYADYYSQNAEAMGYFMVHKQTITESTIQNPEVIARMNDTDAYGKLSEAQVSKASKIIDELGTLYALRNTAKNQRIEFSALINENPEAVLGTLNMHTELKNEANNKLFHGHSAKFIKGYTKEILNPQKEFVTGTLAEEAELRKQGYIRSPLAIKGDMANPDKRDFYLYTRRTGSANSYFSTLMSYTSNRAKGTNVFKMSDDPALARKNNAIIMKRKEAARKRMFKPGALDFTHENNYMVPQLDDAGNTTKYRYMMAEGTKDGLMEQHNDFDDILGAMAGQIVDKQATAVINKETIGALKDMYDTDYALNPRSYIEIGPYAKEERHRDIYYMLPEATKTELDNVWGKNTMLVRKDVIDLVFGYPRYSIVEAFNKNPDERRWLEKGIVETLNFVFRDDAVTHAKTIEDWMTELTKYAKNTIIVRTVFVTLGNDLSNKAYLRSRGVSNRDIFKYTHEAITGALRYQRDKEKLDILKARKKIAPAKNQASIEKAIRVLENEISLNPTTRLIESGLMPTIVDDVETGASQSPFPGRIEKQVTAQIKKLPEVVQNVGKSVFMGEDTQGYKTANNAVKMTDFVSRYVLYHHYIQGKDEGKAYTHDEAMASVIQEFVNFNIPTGRGLEYANQIGLVWFSKYQLRILRVIYDMIKNKPADTLTTFMLGSVVDASNILMSVPGITKDTMQMFGNPVSALIDSSDEMITTALIDKVLPG